MPHHIRRTIAVIVLAAAMCGLFVAPAQAFTIRGGTAEQQAYAREVINASEFDVGRMDTYFRPGILVRIEDHWENYWYAPDADYLPGVAGLAYFNGVIVMRSMDPPTPGSFFGEILAHEFTHLFWFTLPADAWREWGDMVGGTGASWMTNRAESFAEHGKVYAFPRQYINNPSIRSDLRTVDEATFWAFCNKWSSPPTTTTTLPPPPPPPPPTTTTTTVPRGDPFPDVSRESDRELWEAAWWGRDNGILLGYLDGTLGPYGTLTRRHAALMIGRAGGAIRIPWVFDYGVPTRGELAAAYPELVWDSDRWEESLLRSQLLRLLWRAAQ